ncbi:MAG: TonB-dependent receptor [Burkholderiales bacterium]|nr:TonB-dependent receptor [Burkholderiales bacterium]
MRAAPHSRTPRFRLSANALAAACAVLAAGQTWAQEATTPQRVEITGSAIKRIDGETALPVQVITREEIVKAGVTTASEIVATISANANGLTDGASISHTALGQRGFNSANLRGLGTSSTLVLLNGRRLANYASPGDDAGVDLNNIPAAAIERVEVLLDGASAIYGADAIGGVMNFITRSDYAGVEVNAYAGGTQEGGAGKAKASIAAGKGSLARDGYNLFGVLDFQKLSSLRSSQRKFIADYDIPNTLGYLLSSRTMPANLELDTADQIAALQAHGYTHIGEDSYLVNLSAPNCNPPATVYSPLSIGTAAGCAYNYMRDTEIYPESEKASFLGRGTFDLGQGRQVFAELMYSRASTKYVNSPLPTRTSWLDFSNPAIASQFQSAYGFTPDDIGLTGEFRARLRLEDNGNRTSKVDSEGLRLLAGTSGTLGEWDYDAAINHSISKTADTYIDGFVLYNEFISGIEDGTIKLFGSSGDAGKAYLNSIAVRDTTRHSTGTMTAFDAKASRNLMRLSGGPLALALGGEVRRETSKFTPSALLLTNNIYGDSDPLEPIQATQDSRNVQALFAEVLAPFTKELEVQLAARWDHYEKVGGTVNPKLGLRWRPSSTLVLRGSVGKGFRAPSLYELYHPRESGSTGTLADPVLCAQPGQNAATCALEWTTLRLGNPNLKPEKSTQFSLGAVLQPTSQFSVSLDYWNIQKSDVISEVGEQTILSNLSKYGSLVKRYYDDPEEEIEYIILEKANRGKQKSAGLDLVLDLQGLRTEVGQFSAHLAGTWMLKSEQQSAPGDPFVSNLGRFVNDAVVQRWRHRLSVSWEQGPFGLTVGNTYFAGYDDQNPPFATGTGTPSPDRRVSAYSLWDLSGSYDVSKNLNVRAGVQNLFDTAPPFSNQAYYFLSGYDPSYTDPRGRFFYVSAQYKFK